MFEGMFTRPNVNNKQSRGATPALSRPTPSNASTSPMPSAGPIQLPTPLVPAKDETLQKVIQEYINQLSDEDKTAFHNAPNIMERLQEVQGNDKSLISSSLITRVEKVLQCVKSFMGSLGIFIQHSPEISSLVVGGVNCVLTVCTSSAYSTCSILYVTLC